MPLELNQGTAVVATAAVAGEKFGPAKLRVLEENGNIVKLTNPFAPLDKPTTVKVTNTRIANVYQTLAKGAVPLNAQAVNVTGQSIFVEVTAMASQAATTTTPEYLYPVQCRIELRLPNAGGLDETNTKRLLQLTSSLFTNPTTEAYRVVEMMRGVLSLED